MIKANLNMASLIELKAGHYYKMGFHISFGWGVAQLLLEALTKLGDLFWLVVFGVAG